MYACEEARDYSVDQAPNKYCSPSIGLFINTSISTFNWSGTLVDRNLVHSPVSTTQHFANPSSGSGGPSGWVSTATFNSAHSWTNYYNNTANLFRGSSGSDKYRTYGTFVVGSSTIAAGGIGGNHPYLSGVTVPSYVGAVNPNDDSWVSGVLGLDATYLRNATPGGDPSWLEGSGTTDTTPPATPSGVSVNILQ